MIKESVGTASYRGNEDFAWLKCLQRTWNPLGKSLSTRHLPRRWSYLRQSRSTLHSLILYQLNQFVGHRSQASSIWRKVTAVTLKITKNFKKGSKNRNFSYKSPSKFPNIVNWRNHNFIRRVTGHTGWRIDLIGTVSPEEVRISFWREWKRAYKQLEQLRRLLLLRAIWRELTRGELSNGDGWSP